MHKRYFIIFTVALLLVLVACSIANLTNPNVADVTVQAKGRKEAPTNDAVNSAINKKDEMEVEKEDTTFNTEIEKQEVEEGIKEEPKAEEISGKEFNQKSVDTTVTTTTSAKEDVQVQQQNQIKTEKTKATQTTKSTQQKSTQNTQTTKSSKTTQSSAKTTQTQKTVQTQQTTQEATQQPTQQVSVQKTQQVQNQAGQSNSSESSKNQKVKDSTTGNSGNENANNQNTQTTSQNNAQATTTANGTGEDFNARVKRVSALVQPSIVYGTMTQNDGLFKKGETVQVIRDKGNGQTYYVATSDGRKGWISGKSISIPNDPPTVQDRMSKEDIEFYVNHVKQFSSGSQYFIWVDLSRQLVQVFQGRQGKWQLIKTFVCASGKNETPSIRGTFKVYERGKQFSSGGAIAKNWVRFYDSYMFHSILVDSKGNVVDGTLGKRASHGCIRLSLDDSKWIYTNIPNGTTVWVN